jgi:putative ABC transport system permease protein
MLKNYIKIAYKVFLRRKFFTFISLFAISFTLIVLMVATTLLDHALGPHSPENKLDRTLGIFRVQLSGPESRINGTVGYGLLDRYARNLPGAENFSIFSEPELADSYWHGEKIKSYLKRTDGEFWQILEFNFLEGGPFTVEDEKNHTFVAVINDATRKRFFGADTAVGKTIEADGQHFRVVGVVDNVPLLRYVPFSDIWVPISTSKTDTYRAELSGPFMAMILAGSATDFRSIKEEFKTRLTAVEFPDPKEFNEIWSTAETYFESISADWFSIVGSGGEVEGRPVAFMASIISLMILFMLLPAINLVNINVSRIMERASEIGVRKAFGASSRTLIAQLVIENVLITLVGGLIGLIGSVMVLAAVSRSALIPYAQFDMNYRIFFYGLALAIFFGLFSGILPAWKMSRLHPVQALKGATR